jgi:hypothetical protein
MCGASRRVGTWTVAACLFALAPAVNAGPVTYVRQSRGISVGVSEVYPLSGSTTERHANDSATAPDFGTFDRTLTAVVADPPAGQPLGGGQAAASQRSSLTASAIHVSGSFRGAALTPNGAIGFVSYVNPWFDVDQPTDYHLTYRMGQPSRPNGLEASFQLGPPHGRIVFDELGKFGDDGSSASGTVSGTLKPGEYVVIFRFVANALAPSDIDYSARLDLTPAAAVIPLPAAFGPGLAGLAACVMGLLLSSRRARR